MHALNIILPYAEHLSYLGAFLYFAFLGYIIWIPEEIALLAIGYVASVNLISPYPALAVTLAGILCGDNLLFHLARRGSPHLHRFEHKLTSGKLAHYRRLLETHIGKTIALSRLVAGLRFLGPYIAGTKNVSWRQFFFMNGVVSIITVSFFILVGYHFQAKLESIVTDIAYLRHISFLAFIILIGAFVSHRLMRFTKDETLRDEI